MPRPTKGKKRPAKESGVGPVPIEAPTRLNRYIAWAGICSRRKADELIKEGRVRVNGEVVTQLGTFVKPGDEVRVGGETISPRPYVYILLNKPKDTLTTRADERGRATVMDLVAASDAAGAVFPVGRLDRDTLGVLLLTNDGELAHRLMHPRYEIQKIYVVQTKEPVKPHEVDVLRSGVKLDDGDAKADQVGYVAWPDQTRIALQIHEGRNRQVRRMLSALGHEVVQLERIRYAGLTSEGIKRGTWRYLQIHEIAKLRHAVHLK